MKINKKEKIMIFVLIIFLLVGGIYVLGIMPKNNEITTLNESASTIQADIDAVDTQLASVSNSKYNQLVKEIAQNKEELTKYSNPSNNIYEEVLPSNLPGHTDTLEITRTINDFFGNMGFGAEITIGNPTTSSTKKEYSVAVKFDVKKGILYSVLDEVAKIQSYHISYLAIADGEGDNVTGSFSMTLTYVLAD